MVGWMDRRKGEMKDGRMVGKEVNGWMEDGWAARERHLMKPYDVTGEMI